MSFSFSNALGTLQQVPLDTSFKLAFGTRVYKDMHHLMHELPSAPHHLYIIRRAKSSHPPKIRHLHSAPHPYIIRDSAFAFSTFTSFGACDVFAFPNDLASAFASPLVGSALKEASIRQLQVYGSSIHMPPQAYGISSQAYDISSQAYGSSSQAYGINPQAYGISSQSLWQLPKLHIS
ncbi:hypothetical protein ACE6H2_006836 [Prunus campanulata]